MSTKTNNSWLEKPFAIFCIYSTIVSLFLFSCKKPDLRQKVKDETQNVLRVQTALANPCDLPYVKIVHFRKQ